MAKYPGDCAETGFRLFRQWLGGRYARGTKPDSWASDGAVGVGVLTVARRWTLEVTVVNTLAPDADPMWDAARGAIEERLDRESLNLAVFVPRNAPLPAGDEGIVEFVRAAAAGTPLTSDKIEITRPVPLRLRRTSREGSVVTIQGGLTAKWSYFTNRVAGTYILNSSALFRLPSDEAAQASLLDRVVEASSAPDVDSGTTIMATDAWTAVRLEDGPSTVLGTPRPDDDEWSASLRRNTRKLLRQAAERRGTGHTASALAVLGASTYADDERLSWVLRGMDPSHYSGYDIVAVIADGAVKAILEPPSGQLPWDA